MKFKSLSFLVMICVWISSFISPTAAGALAISPQKVTFLNQKGFQLEGWLFQPAGSGPYPAIIMMHGCLGVYSFGDPTQGLNSVFLEWGTRLVNAGYAALLVDSFTPRNIAQNQCDQNGAGFTAVNIRAADAYAGLEYLASQAFVDANNIGLLGWSQGGGAVMAAMDVTKFRIFPRFKAAVTFYPGCGLNNLFGGITESTWKPYAIFRIWGGSADTIVNNGVCRTRISAAQRLGAVYAGMRVYPNAQHSFDSATKVDDRFTQYDVDAKIAADSLTMQLFEKLLH